MSLPTLISCITVKFIKKNGVIFRNRFCPAQYSMKKLLLAFLLLTLSQTLMAQTDDEYKKLFRDQIEFNKSGSSIVAAMVDEKRTRFISYGKLNKDAASASAAYGNGQMVIGRNQPMR